MTHKILFICIYFIYQYVQNIYALISFKITRMQVTYKYSPLQKKYISANAQQTFSKCTANYGRAFAESPNNCNANALRMLSDCFSEYSRCPAFTFHMQMSFQKMRSTNARRMFSECMATTNLHMHISFRRMYGEHTANV